MAISDEKLKIVINNYFKSECDVNTSIREAFEKGFRIGVKKGLMQIEADRKTESNSEIPNNCDTCKYGEDKHRYAHICNECGVGINNYKPKDEPTISKMEQVDEPKTKTETQNSNLTFEKADERCKGCNHYKITCDLFSEICEYEPKDEPQTNKDFKVTYTCSFTDCDNFKNFGFSKKCIECKRKQSEAKHMDEPQTERSE